MAVLRFGLVRIDWMKPMAPLEISIFRSSCILPRIKRLRIIGYASNPSRLVDSVSPAEVT
jgi:hypothetical protein